MVFRMLELPEELVVSILEEVEDDVTLRSLALTCRHLQTLVEPILYHTVFLRTSKQLNALEKSLKRQSRMKYVRSLEMRCKFGAVDNPENSHDRTALSPLGRILLAARNLEAFIFESPFCNGNRWTLAVAQKWGAMEDDLVFPFREAVARLRLGNYEIPPLQSLTTLELHLNGREGREFYDLCDCWYPILLHPRLDTLIISSANIGEEIQKSLGGSCVDDGSFSRTPLKHLRLDECNITPHGLQAVLSLPKALEHIYLGEQRNWQDFDSRFERSLVEDPVDFLKALVQQKDSLKTLFHTPNSHMTWHTRHENMATGLKEFVHLQSIALENNCTCLYDILADDALAPPALKTLSIAGNQVMSDRGFFGVFTDDGLDGRQRDRTAGLRRIIAANPGLEKVNLEFPDWITRVKLDVDLESVLNQFISICAAAKIELTIIRQSPRTMLVAPILYGEAILHPTLMFNSHLGWRLRLSQSQGRPGDEYDEDWDDEDEQGWVDEAGIEIDADDGDWEDELETELEDDDSQNDHLGDNDDWWEAAG